VDHFLTICGSPVSRKQSVPFVLQAFGHSLWTVLWTIFITNSKAPDDDHCVEVPTFSRSRCLCRIYIYIYIKTHVFMRKDHMFPILDIDVCVCVCVSSPPSAVITFPTPFFEEQKSRNLEFPERINKCYTFTSFWDCMIASFF
jgi:hypothetical protein